MPDILVRRLAPSVKERLKQRARANGRSLEAEARSILESAVSNVASAAPDSRAPLGERLKAMIGKSALTPQGWLEFDRSMADDRRHWKMRKFDLGQ
jgi:plasmid stability protein